MYACVGIPNQVSPHLHIYINKQNYIYECMFCVCACVCVSALIKVRFIHFLLSSIFFPFLADDQRPTLFFLSTCLNFRRLCGDVRGEGVVSVIFPSNLLLMLRLEMILKNPSGIIQRTDQTNEYLSINFFAKSIFIQI